MHLFMTVIAYCTLYIHLVSASVCDCDCLMYIVYKFQSVHLFVAVIAYCTYMFQSVHRVPKYTGRSTYSTANLSVSMSLRVVL
jgi:hypothetical protein